MHAMGPNVAGVIGSAIAAGVLMALFGHPILGEMVYGAGKPEKGLEGQCLHARTLKFIHPRTGEHMELTSPLPEYFTAVLARLGPPLDNK